MTVILKSPSGADVQINMWNWRPTVALFGKALAFGEEHMEKLQVNGIGASVSASQAEAIATFLDAFISCIPEGGRVLLDGSISTELKSYELDLNSGRNYSASLGWLIRFRDFCKDSQGFVVV